MVIGIDENPTELKDKQIVYKEIEESKSELNKLYLQRDVSVNIQEYDAVSLKIKDVETKLLEQRTKQAQLQANSLSLRYGNNSRHKGV